jgi:hypothetical protein
MLLWRDMIPYVILRGRRKSERTIQGSPSKASYLFNSGANLNKFKTTPDKFELAYGDGGHLQWEKPEKRSSLRLYKIIDGGLYLFYNLFGNNTLRTGMKGR